MKKNILYITHSYNNFIKDQIELLAKNFNHVYVLVRYKPITEISKFLSINSFKIHRKSFVIDLKNKPKNITVIATPLWYLPFDKFYLNLGIQHFKVVDKIIKKNKIKFDIVHCHFTNTAGFVGKKLKEKYKKPLIITAHGEDIYDFPFRSNKWRKKIVNICNSADHLITVSHSNLLCIKKLKIKTPTTVISNGFSSKLFYSKNKIICRKKLNLNMNKKIILNIGHLNTVKGQKYLISAIKILIKKNKNLLCLIIGNGPLRSTLQSQINQNQLQKHIILLGAIPHNNLINWINASDLFVLPSLNESFGVVQLEAMACGKPIVATKNGGSEEIIINNKIGLLVSSKNSIQLSKAIIKSFNINWDNKYIQNYAKNFQWNKICHQIYKKYQTILNQ